MRCENRLYRVHRSLLVLLLLLAAFLLTACDPEDIYEILPDTTEAADDGAGRTAETIYEKNGVIASYMETDFSNSAGGQVIMRLDNTNDYDVKVVVDLIFYNERGSITDMVSTANVCLQAGATGVEVFESTGSYATFSCDYTVSGASSYSIARMGCLSLATSTEEEGRTSYQIQNTSNWYADAELLVFYFAEDSSLVGYEKKQVSIDAGKTLSGSFEKPEYNYVIDAVYLKLR